MIAYLAQLKPGKMVLWCYLIWYLVTVWFYFDPNLKIWINSLGLSVVIGIGLLLSVSGKTGDRWQVMRLFLMPFCVSSFSSLIKGQGFFLIFSPSRHQLLVTFGACGLFVGIVALLKLLTKLRLR
jgi:hypothetical protein